MKKSNWDIVATYIFALIGPFIYFSTDLDQGGALLLVVLIPCLVVATMLSMGITIIRTIHYKLNWLRLLWLVPIIVFILWVMLYRYF